MKINEFFITKKNHKVFVRTIGERSKPTLLLLHGGPGSHSKFSHLQYIAELDNFFIIQFDQRGCGQSQPTAETKNNTTKDLIEDIETIRKQIGIQKLSILAGSWGSTLGLIYAISYPEKINALILRNIFLARQRDLNWFISSDGAEKFFPDFYKQTKNILTSLKLKRTQTFFKDAYKLFQNSSLEIRKKIVLVTLGLEKIFLELDVMPTLSPTFLIDEELINSTKIFLHYAANNFFIEENYILNNIEKIKQIPTLIVHGRYDMICPPEQAYVLHKHLENSYLFWDNFAGHSLSYNGKKIIQEKINELLIKSS